MSDIDEPLEALPTYYGATGEPMVKLSDVRQALERQRVPEGWKLVPVKPTGAIFEAWCDAGLPPSINAMAKAWRKLLTASEADDETS